MVPGDGGHAAPARVGTDVDDLLAALGAEPTAAEAALLEQLPVGVMVIGFDTSVRYANRQAVTLTGAGPSGILGARLLDIADPADLDFALDVVEQGTGFDGALLGPIRLRYTRYDGVRRTTDCWSRELADRSGYAVVFTEQSTSIGLGDVAVSIAAGDAIETTVGLAVEALASNPMSLRACVLAIEPDDVRPLSAWPLSEPPAALRWAPWNVAARGGHVLAPPAERLPDAAREALARHGFATVWARPVRHGARVVAVLVMFREVDRPATANQERHAQQVVSLLELGFAQAAQRATLEQAALVDPLTGLANRARLDQLLDLDEPGVDAVLYLDLDGFKQVNDRHGHPVGDEILREVGRRLGAGVRGRDHVVRMGGDEFVVLLGHGRDTGAPLVAERLLVSLSAPYPTSVGPIGTVSVSIGTAEVGPSTKVVDALRSADAALLRAKRSGKGRAEAERPSG